MIPESNTELTVGKYYRIEYDLCGKLSVIIAFYEKTPHRDNDRIQGPYISNTNTNDTNDEKGKFKHGEPYIRGRKVMPANQQEINLLQKSISAKTCVEADFDWTLPRTPEEITENNYEIF